MVIIDSLLAGTVGLTEDSPYLPENVTPILRALEKLAADFNVAVVIIHHLAAKKISSSTWKKPYNGYDVRRRYSPIGQEHMVGSEVGRIKRMKQ